MPPVNQVSVNTVLTNIAVRYMQNQEEFIATKVFPRVPVQQSAGSYIKFDIDMYGRSGAKPRADVTESAGGTWKQTSDTYNTLPVKAWHTDIGAQLRANYPSHLALDTEATEFVARVIMQSLEKEFAEKYFKAGVWANEVTVSSKWDASNTNIVKQVKAAKRVVHKASMGVMPNTLVIPGPVYDELTENPDILSRIISGGTNATPAMVTKNALAQVFGVENVWIAEAINVTSPEGDTVVADYTYGDSVLLTYAAKRPGLFTPSGGYVFDWVGYLEGKGGSTGVTKWWMQEVKADRFEQEYACDMKVVAPQMGYLFKDVLA